MKPVSQIESLYDSRKSGLQVDKGEEVFQYFKALISLKKLRSLTAIPFFLLVIISASSKMNQAYIDGRIMPDVIRYLFENVQT